MAFVAAAAAVATFAAAADSAVALMTLVLLPHLNCTLIFDFFPARLPPLLPLPFPLPLRLRRWLRIPQAQGGRDIKQAHEVKGTPDRGQEGVHQWV